MPTIRSDFLNLLKQQEKVLDAAWSGLADQLAAIIARYADADGTIPLDKWRQLRREIADTIQRFVLARPENAAFRVLSGGTVLPLSPFFSILWDTLSESMRLAVLEQNNFLTQHVANEIQGNLRRAFLDPFMRLNELPPEEAAALRRYQHPLEARRSDGLMIEQRLPVAVADLQRRTTALLNVLLSEQTSGTDIGNIMRQYYAGDYRRPGSWGVRAGERLLKIARSEPIFAFSQASVAAAATNPFVVEVYVERTRSVACAVCDPIVQRSPYSIENVPYPGFHGNCVCRLRYVVRSTPKWDYTSDPQWTRTVGAMSTQLVQRLLRL